MSPDVVKGRITRLALVRGYQLKITMTEELQRIRIAETLGWKEVLEPWRWADPSGQIQENWAGKLSVPDYLHDLSACTALIDFLEKRGYACVMVAQHGKRCCTFTTTGRPDYKAICDTFPKAICKSFLTVLGLWES